MKASFKKHLSHLDLSYLIGKEVPLTDRETGNSLSGKVTDITGSEITVEFSNGRFESTFRRFRRDIGTQLGGSLRLNFSQILA